MQTVHLLGVSFGDVVPAPGTPTLATLADPPWYATWWGIGLIVVVGIGSYEFVVKPKLAKKK